MQLPKFDSGAGNTHGGSATTISANHVLGKGNFPYVIVAIQAETLSSTEANSVLTDVTYNGVSMKRINPSNDWLFAAPSGGGTTKHRLSLWYMDANSLPTTPGTYSIVATFTGSTNSQGIVAASFFNLRQVAPLGLVQESFTSAGGVGTISGTVSPNILSLVVECTACSNVSGFSVPSPQTLAIQASGSGNGAVEISFAVLPNAITMSSSNSNAEGLGQGVFYIPFLASPFGGIM